MRCHNNLLGIFLLILCVSVWGAEPNDWSGTWDTRWQAGDGPVSGAVLYLHQRGGEVTGEYPLYDGEIQGSVQGQLLLGEWHHRGASGSFVFTLAPDGQSFVGRFDNEGWWTGGRRQPGVERLQVVTDLSSPRRSLRSFLLTVNWAVDHDTFENLDLVLQTIDTQHLGKNPVPEEQLKYSRDLFQVLSELTFRLREIPNPGTDTQLEVHLPQAGTGDSFRLEFRYNTFGNGGAGWQMLPPPPEQLQRTLARLRDYHGADRQDPRGYLRLRNPRDTLRTLLLQLRRLESGGREHVLRTLNLSRVSESIRDYEGEMLALYLREILDRIGWVIWQEIPNDPESRVPYVHFRHPLGVIEIAPVETDTGTLWQFTPGTLDSLRRLYGAMDDLAPVAELQGRSPPPLFFQVRQRIREFDRNLLTTIGGLELWQWMAVVGIISLGIILGWCLSGIGFWLVRRWLGLKYNLAQGLRFVWPTRLVLVAGLWLVGMGLVGLPETTLHVFRAVNWVLLIVSLTVLLYSLVVALGEYYENIAERVGYRYEILRSLLLGTVKVGILIGGVLALAEALAIPYQGVIAGFGIGGVAVALAARTTLENFIGGLTLFADKPLEIGDFCRFGEKLGTVERIGLRSTRVRSLERTLISIPNAEFVNLHLENYTRRERMLLHFVLQLRYETTPDQLRHVLTRLRQLLIAHPRVMEEPARVRFVGFGASSLDLEVFAYVNTADWGEFLGIREDVLLRMIDVVKESGTGFAFPSQTLYMARDGGLDGERRQAAEEAVAAWRANNQLPFPDMDSTAIESWRSSLDFPPRGSVSHPGSAEVR